MPTISNTFETEEPLLEDLLRQIELGHIQLPDFQRGWVWDDEHIRALIVSITLGYPIGALMSMETGGDARFAPRPFEGVETQTTPELLLLDGQQRMTSLFLALKSSKPVPTSDGKGHSISRYYYLNMEKCLDPNTPREEAVLSLRDTKKTLSNFGRTIDLDLSTPEKEYEQKCFPINIIFNREAFRVWRKNYRKFYDDDALLMDLYDQFEEEIISPLGKYKIPVIKLHKETPKEAICQVFEHVNTGGVPLNVFELLTATYAADDFRLRSDWNARKALLHETDKTLTGVEGTDFLAAVTLLASFWRSRKSGTAVGCKRTDILALPLEDYKTYSNILMDGMKKAARFLHSNMVFTMRDLPYQTQLIPLSAICACLGKRFDEPSIRCKLARWYWCGVFGELYGSANETRYALDIQNFMDWIDGGSEPVTIRDASFTPTRMLSMQTRNSAAYKGLMALMIDEGCKDFITGDSIRQNTHFEELIDIHHIFPADWCKKQGLPYSTWNSIVNKTPLSSTTNRIIGGNAPSVYLDRLERNHHVSHAALNNCLSSHLIDPELLRHDDFTQFIRDRAGKLLDRIEKAMGKSCTGRTSEETVMAFGGELPTSTL